MHRTGTQHPRPGNDSWSWRYRPSLDELESRLAPGSLLGTVHGGPLSPVFPGCRIAAPADPAACPPTQETVSGDFSVIPVLPILNHPLLQATLTGTAGTFQGHIVFQPIPVPLSAISDGCQENSQFTVQGFVGSLTLT